MSKTSVIQMMKFIENLAEQLTKQGGTFTSDQLSSAANTKFGVTPGSGWLSMQLLESYNLIDGLWHRKF